MKVKELLHEFQTNQDYQELDELSFIRKIYIEIGKNKTFDVRYYFGNTATQKQIYRLAKSELELKIDLMTEKLYVIR